MANSLIGFNSKELKDGVKEATEQYTEQLSTGATGRLKLQYPVFSEKIDKAISYGYTPEQIEPLLARREETALSIYKPEEVNNILGRTPETMQAAENADDYRRIRLLKEATGTDLDDEEIRDRLKASKWTGINAALLVKDKDLYEKTKPFVQMRGGYFDGIRLAVADYLRSWEHSNMDMELVQTMADKGQDKKSKQEREEQLDRMKWWNKNLEELANFFAPDPNPDFDSMYTKATRMMGNVAISLAKMKALFVTGLSPVTTMSALSAKDAAENTAMAIYNAKREEGQTPEQAFQSTAKEWSRELRSALTAGGTTAAELMLLGAPVRMDSSLSPVTQKLLNIGGASAISGANAFIQSANVQEGINGEADLKEAGESALKSALYTGLFGLGATVAKWKELRNAQKIYNRAREINNTLEAWGFDPIRAGSTEEFSQKFLKTMVNDYVRYGISTNDDIRRLFKDLKISDELAEKFIGSFEAAAKAGRQANNTGNNISAPAAIAAEPYRAPETYAPDIEVNNQTGISETISTATQTNEPVNSVNQEANKPVEIQPETYNSAIPMPAPNPENTESGISTRKNSTPDKTGQEDPNSLEWTSPRVKAIKKKYFNVLREAGYTRGQSKAMSDMMTDRALKFAQDTGIAPEDALNIVIKNVDVIRPQGQTDSVLEEHNQLQRPTGSKEERVKFFEDFSKKLPPYYSISGGYKGTITVQTEDYGNGVEIQFFGERANGVARSENYPSGRKASHEEKVGVEKYLLYDAIPELEQRIHDYFGGFPTIELRDKYQGQDIRNLTDEQKREILTAAEKEIKRIMGEPLSAEGRELLEEQRYGTMPKDSEELGVRSEELSTPETETETTTEQEADNDIDGTLTDKKWGLPKGYEVEGAANPKNLIGAKKHQFVLRNGKRDWGYITEELAQGRADVPTGAIRVPVGNRDYGLKHAITKHMNVILGNAVNIEDFIDDVINNGNKIIPIGRDKEGRLSEFLVEWNDTKRNQNSIVISWEEKDGGYYILKSAYTPTKEYIDSLPSGSNSPTSAQTPTSIPSTATAGIISESNGNGTHYEDSDNAEILPSNGENVNGETQKQGEIIKGRVTWDSNKPIYEQTAEIELSKDKDETTPFHEIGHVFLKMLLDASKVDGVNQEVIDDVNAVFEHAGVTAEEYENDTDGAKEKVQESWSEDFVKYAATGRAPNKRLLNAFTRFKAWLLDMFRTMQKNNIRPDETMRRIFNNLFTSQEKTDYATKISELATEAAVLKTELNNLQQEKKFNLTPEQIEELFADENQDTDDLIYGENGEKVPQFIPKKPEKQEAPAQQDIPQPEGNVELEAANEEFELTQENIEALEATISEIEAQRELLEEFQGLEAPVIPQEVADKVSKYLEDKEHEGALDEVYQAKKQGARRKADRQSAERYNPQVFADMFMPYIEINTDTLNAFLSQAGIDATREYLTTRADYVGKLIKNLQKRLPNNYSRVLSEQSKLDGLTQKRDELKKKISDPEKATRPEIAERQHSELKQKIAELDNNIKKEREKLKQAQDEYNGIKGDIDGLVNEQKEIKDSTEFINRFDPNAEENQGGNISEQDALMTLAEAINKGYEIAERYAGEIYQAARAEQQEISQRQAQEAIQEANAANEDEIRRINKEHETQIDRLKEVQSKKERQHEADKHWLKIQHLAELDAMEAEYNTKLSQEKEKAAALKEKIKNLKNEHKIDLIWQRDRLKEQQQLKLMRQEDKYEAQIDRLKERLEQIGKIQPKIQRIVKSLKKMGEKESIKYERRKEISEILSGYDFRKPTKKLLANRSDVEAFLTAYPESAEQMTASELKYAFTTTIADMSLDDLEKLHGQVKAIYEQGEKEFKDWEADNKQRREAITEQLRERLEQTPAKTAKIIKNSKDKNKQYEGVAGKLERFRDSARATILPPDSVFDTLDGGGAKYDGAWERYMMDSPNEKINVAEKHIHRREKNMKDRLIKNLGLKIQDFTAVLGTHYGEDFTVDEVMEIYAGMRNPKKKSAIIFGTFVNQLGITPEEAQNTINDLISKLSDKHKEAVEYVLQDHEENKERINQSQIDAFNRGMNFETDYTSMHRTEYRTQYGMIDPEDDEAIRGGMDAAGILQRIDNGFTLSRQEIADENQKPLKLGLFSNWLTDIRRQEYAAALSGYANDMMHVLLTRGDNKKTLLQEIADRHGDIMKKSVVSIFNDMMTDSQRAGYDFLDGFAGALSQNASAAYIAFNTGVYIMQTTSYPMFLMHTTPGYLLKSLGEFLYSFEKFATGKTDSIEFLEQVYELSPQLRVSGGDPIVNALINKTDKTKWQRLISVGLTPTSIMDRVTKATGWWGVYKYCLEKQKMTQQEAIREADKAVRLTQPSSTASNSIRLGRNNKAFRSIIMKFSSAVVPIYNTTFYRFGESFKRAFNGKTREEKIDGAVSMTMAMLGGGLAIILASLLQNGGPKTKKNGEKENVAEWLAKSYTKGSLSSIPLFGKIGSSLWDSIVSDSYNTGKSSNLITQPFEDIAKVIAVLRKNNRLSDKDRERMFWYALEAAALTTGTPYSALKNLHRSLRLLKERKPGKAILNTIGIRQY